MAVEVTDHKSSSFCLYFYKISLSKLHLFREIPLCGNDPSSIELFPFSQTREEFLFHVVPYSEKQEKAKSSECASPSHAEGCLELLSIVAG